MPVIANIPTYVIENMRTRAAAMHDLGRAAVIAQIERALVEAWHEGAMHALATRDAQEPRTIHAGRPVPDKIWLCTRDEIIGAHIYTSAREAEFMTEDSGWKPCGPYVRKP